jgi:hypothetical protein
MSTRFPISQRSGKSQSDGGIEAEWARDGRELSYRNGDKVMVGDIRTQPNFQPQPPRVLFEGSYPAGTHSYDVAADGQHFLMIKQDQSSTFLTEALVILGWADELKRRTAEK